MSVLFLKLFKTCMFFRGSGNTLHYQALSCQLIFLLAGEMVFGTPDTSWAASSCSVGGQ